MNDILHQMETSNVRELLGVNDQEMEFQMEMLNGVYPLLILVFGKIALLGYMTIRFQIL